MWPVMIVATVCIALAWFTTFEEEGPLLWMGTYFATQGAALSVIIGAWSNAPPISARLFTALSRVLNTKMKLMTTVILFWLAMLVISYFLGLHTRLEFGIAEILGVCFPVSTYLFYAGRHVTTKSLVKALDYFTIAAIGGTLVSVADFDTQTYKERTHVAMVDAKTIVATLQPKLNELLAPCNKSEMNDNAAYFEFHLSFRYLRAQIFGSVDDLNAVHKRIFCYCFGRAKGSALGDLPEADISYVALQARRWNLAMPPDPLTAETVDLFRRYAKARTQYEVHKDKPLETYIPKPVAYLLAAFAFAVRLTRTTLEVFEWHDVTAVEGAIPVKDEPTPIKDAPSGTSKNRRPSNRNKRPRR